MKPAKMESNWREDRVLGHGSFGFVRLFVNKMTSETIALKEMKAGILDNLEPSQREKMMIRLKTEIKIMWEHDHDHLVKAVCRPENMLYTPDESVIHVWMEYCDGGDLRKNGLNKPHNCCGLPEPAIRRILTHINSGLVFLHRNHIIHRDLKPENILLKRGPNGEAIYKLTDFGYAKVYGTSSRADSMVGTLQYVAPEILHSMEHGRTVDFWSFGVIVFELCTGIRPFLHFSKRPTDWAGPIWDKPDDCIYMYWPETGNSHATSNKMPKPNDLSSNFEMMLTEWLRMALHLSPDKRGGVASGTPSMEDAPCLVTMDRLLRTKILNLFCMSSGDVFEMAVTSTDNLSSLREWLHTRIHSSSADLYLVTSKGQIITPTDVVEDICQAFFEPNVYTTTIFMYTTALQPSFKLVQEVLPSVMNLIAVGDQKINKDDKPTIYAHVYHHLHEFWKLFNRLHSGHKAIMCVIRGIEDELRALVVNNSLSISFYRCLGAAHQVQRNVSKDLEMLLENDEKLKELQVQCNVADNWSEGIQMIAQRIESRISEVQLIEREAEELLTTTEVMNQRHICSERHFSDFHTKYVTEALNIYKDAKVGNSCNGMAELLQLATHQAENIIQDDFNGVDYISVYLKLISQLKAVKAIDNESEDLRRDCDNISSNVRSKFWSLILASQQPTKGYASQLSPSLFKPAVSRTDSVSSSSSSTISAHNIIQRLYSSHSTEESDGPVDSLLGSLKEHIDQVSKNSENVMAKNKSILSRLKDPIIDSNDENGTAKNDKQDTLT